MAHHADSAQSAHPHMKWVESANIVNHSVQVPHKPFAAPDSFAIADSNLTVAGNWPWGSCNVASQDSPYTVISNGDLLQFLLWNSASLTPSVYVQYNIGLSATDMQIVNGVAFITSGLEFVTFDLTNPNHTVRLGSLQLSDFLGSFVIFDSLAFLTSEYGYVYVVSISDPSSPRLLSSSETANPNPSSIAVRNGYCYVGSWPASLNIFDVRDPDSIKPAQTIYPGLLTASIVVDSFLVLGVGGQYCVQFYSLTDPKNPVLYSELSLPRYDSLFLSTFAVSGSHLYATTDSDGTFNIDISDIAHPRLLDRQYLPLLNNNGGGEVVVGPNGLVEIACQNGLVAYNAEDSLRYLGFFPTGGGAQSVVTRGSLVAVSSGVAGLWLIDASNPTAPRGIANINNGGFTEQSILNGNRLVIYDFETETSLHGTCYLYDISDSARPKFEAKFQPPSLSATSPFGVSLCLDHNLLFVAQSQTPGPAQLGVEIFDISDSLSPQQVATINTTYTIVQMIAHDGILYLGTRDSGLYLIDYSSIQNVHLTAVSRNGNDETVAGFALGDSVLYDYSSVRGITVYSISNTGIIDTLGYLAGQAWNYPVSMCADGHLLYYQGTYVISSDGNRELYPSIAAVDISEPTDLRPAGYFVSDISDFPLGASGGNVYLGYQGPELYVLHNSLVTGITRREGAAVPDAYRLEQNFPNPFNPTTTISYYLPRRDHVVIELFDELGRAIRTIFQGELTAGKHSMPVNAAHLSSGVYYYRMTTPTFSAVKKMEVIK
jgi:hypothetical protein